MVIAGHQPDGSARQAAILLLAFTLAIFSSAFLLFFIQPMFTKMVLPHLGGSPAVWSIAMVVFQSLLLAGYAYAHLSVTRLGLKISTGLHVALLAVTLFALPIAVSDRLGAPPSEGQAFWLIGVFMLSVGLPFFTVAGNGPLLQAWFARSCHEQASDPYFLYGASNLGSFAALILCPVLFEPLFSVRWQAWGWTFGFGLFIVLIAVSAVLVLWRGEHAGAAAQKAPLERSPPPSATRIFGWVALSFIPSGLMVAVTAHISTDVAAAPFLWVIPLALFLLTFVLIFRDRPLAPMGLVERFVPILAASLILFSYFGTHMFVVVLLVHTGFFFCATLMCHFQLYHLRPAADRLTSFYLWMSVGGVLGGLFCGLLAQMIFSNVAEYPILAVLAVAALPQVWRSDPSRLLRTILPIALIGLSALGALQLAYGASGKAPHQTVYVIFLIVAAGTMLLFRAPIVVMTLLTFLFLTLDRLQSLQGGRITERSFFGVHKIEMREQGQFRILSHGTTVHGAIRIQNADGTPVTGRPKPLTYYHPEAPMADVLRALPARPAGRELAVVGLGAGAHVCNGRDGHRWTYFEIDSIVVALAQDRAKFRFLSECAPQTRIILGDARLTLAKEPASRFDNLVINAFSSDSIPVHLLTREALELYVSRLAPGGILTLHISNRHLELESVVASLAKVIKLPLRVKHHSPGAAKTYDDPVGSVVVAPALEEATLAPLDAMPGWRLAFDRGTRPWTDDFSNIVTAI